MELVIEISCPNYDLLVNYSNCFSRGYRVLKNGVIVRRRRKDGSVERVVVIRCSEEEAKLLVELAKTLCPDVAPEIEKAGLLREL